MMASKRLIIIALVVILAGCSSLLSPQKSLRVNIYSLSKANMQRYGRPSHQTILVSRPQASPAYQTAKMLYSQHPYELKAFVHHRWATPPAEMLQPLLVASLRNTRHYEAVVSVPYPGLTDLRLDTQLMQLQQDITRHQSRVRMEVQAILTSNKTHRAIASKHFSAVITSAANPYAGVQAANRATQKIMTSISCWAANAA